MDRWRRQWLMWALRPDDGGGDGGGSGSGDGGGDGGKDGGGDPGGAGGNGGGTGDPEALRAELARARDEAAKSRRELQRLRQANESEQDKLRREHEERGEQLTSAQARLRGLELEVAVLRQAGGLGIVDPEAAQALVQLPEDAWAEDGKPDAKKLEAALRDLVKRKPYLVRQGSAAAGDSGDTEPGRDPRDMNERLRSAFGRGAR